MRQSEMVVQGFLNRRSGVRIPSGTLDFFNEINASPPNSHAHEARTAHRTTVYTGTKDGTVVRQPFTVAL